MGRTAFALVTKPIVVIMRSNDAHHRYAQQRNFVIVKNLLEDEETKTQGKNQYRCWLAVMPNVSVQQGINAHGKSDTDHAPLKKTVVDDVDPQNREAGDQYRQ